METIDGSGGYKSEEERTAAESFNAQSQDTEHEGKDTQGSETLKEEWKPDIENLSDKDFMRKFQENGFGWQTFTDTDKPIIDRWKKIREGQANKPVDNLAADKAVAEVSQDQSPSDPRDSSQVKEETPAPSAPREDGVWRSEGEYAAHQKSVLENMHRDANQRFEEARHITNENIGNVFQTDNYFQLQENLLQLNRQGWQGIEGRSGYYKTEDLLYVVDQIPSWVKTYEQQKMSDEQLESFLASQGVTRGSQELPFRECVKKCIKNAWAYERRNLSRNK